MNTFTKSLVSTALVLACASVDATPIACNVVSETVNYMQIDDSEVSACLDSGSGNINGNTNGRHPDPYLTDVGEGYQLIGKSDSDNPYNLLFSHDSTASGSTGEWSFDADAWDDWERLAIGFKFGTGNTADSWFVYSVSDLVNSGNWDFFKSAIRNGGGLSHTNLYGMGKITVPEPATMALFGSGLILLAAAARRRRRK